jgi:hypothetical protein
MKKRTVLTILLFCFTLSLAADQKPAEIYFGGKRFVAGMSKSQAAALLSECCILHPALDSEPENMSSNAHGMVGHFVDSKQDQHALGSVFFVGSKVARVSRPLDDEFNTSSDDVVAFARALDRGLLTESDKSQAVVVSAHHQRFGNAEDEDLTFTFSNGRRIELQITTLDTPSKAIGGKRDMVGLDEAVEFPSQ